MLMPKRSDAPLLDASVEAQEQVSRVRENVVATLATSGRLVKVYSEKYALSCVEMNATRRIAELLKDQMSE